MLLLTGATGFVGQNLLKKLTDKKIKVRCFVRNPKKIPESNETEIVQGNLLDKETLFKATQNIDAVLHLASTIKSPVTQDFINVNVKGTENLIEACIKNKVKKIIHVSSLDATLKETNIYGQTKATGEEIVRNSSLNYIILRPALIYGKKSKEIDMLTEWIRKFPTIPVIGDGKGKLQPVYVDDVCDILIKLMESDVKNKTYYIAGDQEISLNDLIDKIAGLYSKKIIKIHIPLQLLWLPLKTFNFISRKSTLNYEALRALNQNKTCEIDELKKDFGFNPISLDDGLKIITQKT